MDELGFLKKIAVSSIPLLDLSNIYFVRVRIFLEVQFIPMEDAGFPAGFVNDKVIHRLIHGFYVSNMDIIHRGMEDVGNPAGFFDDRVIHS